jgi:hypothetical protein
VSSSSFGPKIFDNRFNLLLSQSRTTIVLKKQYLAAKMSKLVKNENQELKAHFERQIKNWGLTKGARFEAARRHKKRGRLSQLSTLILSLYVMLFTMVSLAGVQFIGGAGKQFLDIAVIVLSSGIIGFSIYENAKKHEMRADHFLKSAKEIAEVQSEGELSLATGIFDVEKVKRLQDKYELTLSRFEDNHSHLDYDIHKYNISQGKKFELFKLKKDLLRLTSGSTEHGEKLLDIERLNEEISHAKKQKTRTSIKAYISVHGIFLVSIFSPLIVYIVFLGLVVLMNGISSLRVENTTKLMENREKLAVEP